jgi:hypothetical protein
VKDINIKTTFSIEKSFECKGSMDMKNGASKKCEAGLKKKDSIGLYASDLAKDVASEVEKLHESVAPTVESFLPMDDVMARMMKLDDDATIDSLEDGYSTTVGFGGRFTAEWGCNVTFTKAVGKLTRIVSCGVKSTEGSTMEGIGEDTEPVLDEKAGQEF